jgi:SAM-dependent methyltransferase
MTHYGLMYRLGITPWEDYGGAVAASLSTLLDREESERSRPLGRALDLGCGRGQYTPELARRGCETTGIDDVPSAVEAARAKGPHEVTYVVGDVTDLPAARLGTFDLFLDVGCFQGFGGERSGARVGDRRPLRVAYAGTACGKVKTRPGSTSALTFFSRGRLVP